MTRETSSQLLRKIPHILPMLLFACALYLMHKQLQTHDFGDMLRALQSMSLTTVIAAFVLTVINYLVLAAYDWLALRFTGHLQVPLLKMTAAALLSYSISNNTGHAWAAGGSIRYRFYSKWGVPGWDILKISLFQTITYLLGAISLGMVGSLLLPLYLAKSTQTPPTIHWLSLVCAAALLVYWLAVLLWRKPILIKGYSVYLPSPLMTFWQTAIAGIDIVLSSLVLWVLLLGKIDMEFGPFLVVFVVAQVLGVISQVPGGIGVFESAFLWLMTDVLATDQHLLLISALLLYRVVYYFIPLLLAGLGLVGFEIYQRREFIADSTQTARRMLSTIVPHLYSMLLLLAGGLLLVSGAMPANPEMLDTLSDLLPLPIVELSHLTGSLTGLLLLFLARGIRLQIDAAWFASLGLLGIGIMTCFLKGFNWREALVLSLILVLMLPTRRYFQRRSSLLQLSFSKSWLMAVAMVVAGSVWLGYFAYRDVDYAHDLWWQFSYQGNVSRFLRTLLLLSVVSVCYGLSRLFTVAPPQALLKPTAAELNEAQQIVMHSPEPQAYLALLGDKYLFWNAQRSGFIMFVPCSQYWIAMGDPIGDSDAFEELLYRFQEQADRNGAKVVFYQASPEWLPAYLELGLSFFKLGEEAKVNLSTFSLQGKQRDALRSARNKFAKLDYRFEILSGVAVEDALPVLRRISDAWLSNKNTREKGFSLGFFDEQYIRRTDVAVIKDELGQIQAFANLWQTEGREVLSIDLMRYDPGCPKGVMDFLFAELLLWGQAQQYHWFSLGMAPLAGLEHRPLAPLWHKMGAAIFKFGDHFYNFEGLYEYKAKFSPVWQARYLAAPAGLSVPFIFMRITRLISGGWRGVFGK